MILLLGIIVFDVVIFEIYGVLFNGGKLIVVKKE